MVKVRRVWPCVIALTGALAVTGARGQQDLDAGKTGPQLFAQDCSACHRSPQGLAKTVSGGSLVSFLRQHYTSSSTSASVVAAYLQSAGPGSRAKQQGQPGDRSKAARPGEPGAAPMAQPPGTPPAAGAKQGDRVARPAEAAADQPPRPGRRSRRPQPGEPGAPSAPEAGQAAAPTAEAAPSTEAAAPAAVAAPQAGFSEPLP